MLALAEAAGHRVQAGDLLDPVEVLRLEAARRLIRAAAREGGVALPAPDEALLPMGRWLAWSAAAEGLAAGEEWSLQEIAELGKLGAVVVSGLAGAKTFGALKEATKAVRKRLGLGPLAAAPPSRIDGALSVRTGAQLAAALEGATEPAAGLKAAAGVEWTLPALARLERELETLARRAALGHALPRGDDPLHPRTVAPGKATPKPWVGLVEVLDAAQHVMPGALDASGRLRVQLEPSPQDRSGQQGAPLETVVSAEALAAVRGARLGWRALQAAHRLRAFALAPEAAAGLAELLDRVAAWYAVRAGEEARKLKAGQVTMAVASKVRPRGLRISGPAYAVAEPASALGHDFEDASARLGLPLEKDERAARPVRVPSPQALGGALAVGDANGDGWPDLYVAWAGQSWLLENRGEAAPGTFAPAPAEQKVPQVTNVTQAFFHDALGDGHDDLLLIRQQPPALLLAQRLEPAPRHWREEASRHRIAAVPGAQAAALLDVSGDGLLDLFIGSHLAQTCEPGKPGRCVDAPRVDGGGAVEPWLGIYDRQGRFTAPTAAGLRPGAWVRSAATTDLDLDGSLDLLVAHPYGPDAVYQRASEGATLEDRGARWGFDHAGPTLGITPADFDGDGRIDLYVARPSVGGQRLGLRVGGEAPIEGAALERSGEQLLLQKGPEGALVDAGWGPRARWPWSGAAFDADNDGDLDLYVATGVGESDRLYLNALESGTFALKAARGLPESTRGDARSVAAVDVDVDGDLDLVVVRIGGPPLLLLNKASAGNHLSLKLTGPPGNSRAVGAIVRVTPGASESPRTQVRSVGSAEGWHTQPSPFLHFGLGEATEAKVKVRWPGGHESEHTLAAGRRHELRLN